MGSTALGCLLDEMYFCEKIELPRQAHFSVRRLGNEAATLPPPHSNPKKASAKL